MIIYIAGPMSGLDDCNRAAFNAVAKRLSFNGDTPLNPALLPHGLSQHQYMDICFAMLRSAEAIYLLKGWEASAGASAEYHYAYKMGLKVFNQC